MSVPLAAVRELLLLKFPLDGLRKAAERLGSTAHVDARNKKTAKVAYVDAILTVLVVADPAALPAVPVVHSAPMWAECVAAGVPWLWCGDASAPLPPLVDAKRAMAHGLATYLTALAAGGQTIVAISTGKASARTRHAERTAYGVRWCGRYGKPKHGFTGMRRLYADESAGANYKEREEFALQMEEHVFQLLRQRFDGSMVKFSPESGRRNTGTTFGPGWCVFVYLAVKTTDE
jgi:hypothetical protein